MQENKKEVKVFIKNAPKSALLYLNGRNGILRDVKDRKSFSCRISDVNVESGEGKLTFLFVDHFESPDRATTYRLWTEAMEFDVFVHWNTLR